ncbi:hypothetical protein Vafri_3694, partial [Volvox africanus]
PPGCHGSPSYHLHLRTSYSLSYDDLSQLSQATCHQIGALPALGAALNDLVADRATSLPFELTPAVVAAAAAAGHQWTSDSATAAAVAAAAKLLRRDGGDGGSGGGGGGGGGGNPPDTPTTKPNLPTMSGLQNSAPFGGIAPRRSFDVVEPTSGQLGLLQDLQPGGPTHGSAAIFGAGGGSGGAAAGWTTGPSSSGVGVSAAVALAQGGPAGWGELPFPGTRLSFAERSGGRWVVFCCDCAAELVHSGGALAALATARRAAAERSLPLTEVAQQLQDERLSALLRHALADVHVDIPAACLGFGVLSCLGCTDTRALLAAGGVSLSDLDFLSCNNGCQLWLTGMKVRIGVGANGGGGDGGGGGGGGGENGNGSLQLEDPKLLFDERYERHMEYRWEATAAKQVVRRILSNRSGWGKLPLGQPGRPAPRISALGPYHIMVTFSGAAARDVNPSVLLSRFRRKLRLSGLRAQLVVTPAVAPSSCGRATSGCAGGGGSGGSGGAGVSQAGSMGLSGAAAAADSSLALESFTLHVVPLRCSRAMVLRYISAWYGIPLEDMTLAAFSTGGGGGHIAATALHCSDAEDLVAGQQRVVLMPEAPALVEGCQRQRYHQQPEVASSAPPGIFTIDLSPYLTSGRVAVVV